MNCLGNEVESGCVIYSGPDLPQLSIKTGDSLDSVISKIVGSTTTASTAVTSTNTTTDSIMSKSSIRGASSTCGSLITVRDFEYTLSLSNNSIVLSYNLMDIVRNLPSGYETVATRTLVTGTPINGLAVISDSRAISSSITIPVSRYPVTVEFLLRLTAPCGQLDMTYTLNLFNPSLLGKYRLVMNVTDINPSSGDVALTEHLNSIESRLQRMDGLLQATIDGSTKLAMQENEISSLKSSIEDPSELKVSYSKNGGNYSDSITTIMGDLYQQVKTLQDQITSQNIEVSNIKNTIKSM